MPEDYKNILEQFEPVSLEELKDYKLLNRIDTKYICNYKQLPEVLKLATEHFNIQTISDERIFSYESLYFDTDEKKSYYDHHQGKRIRYKVRFRKYLDTGDSFLEIKKKKNSNRTNKRRLQFEFCEDLNTKHKEFLNSELELNADAFKPAIWTIFDRITLAGKNHIERITIDTNIRFKNELNEVSIPELIIIEVKRDKSTGISPFTKILRSHRIRPMGISKYVLGNIMLSPELKHNRFKNKLITINRICYDT
jgi:VTC domain